MWYFQTSLFHSRNRYAMRIDQIISSKSSSTDSKPTSKNERHTNYFKSIHALYIDNDDVAVIHHSWRWFHCVLKALECVSLRHRLTRVEVQMQERSDSQRNMISDASRRLQNIEGSVARLQTVLDLVHDESTVIRASQSELKLQFNSQSRESTSAVRGVNLIFPERSSMILPRLFVPYSLFVEDWSCHVLPNLRDFLLLCRCGFVSEILAALFRRFSRSPLYYYKVPLYYKVRRTHRVSRCFWPD